MQIDVIIPTFNTARFISEAIESVRTQTYQPQKIIVVDDGSTDDTEYIVHSINDPRILYIKKNNGGPNSARNVGLTHATAELVAFLDADDRWESTKLEKQYMLFMKDTAKSLGLVYTSYYPIDALGNHVTNIPIVPIDPIIQGYAFERLLPGNLIIGSSSSVLIRRLVFDVVGMFDESLRIGEDWDMWLRISEKFRIEYVDEPLVAIRRHEDNQTSDVKKLIAGDSAFIEKWVPLMRGRYTIPQLWADRIVLNVLRGFPSLYNYRLAKRSLSLDTRKKLFIGGSLFLTCITTVLRIVADKNLRSRIYRSLKRYGKK